ncbi:UNVERIFIED_CONTAM: hypothetical protein H355_006237 [Colinus virginianus]|nr:hypothetical protein H355_006237 [Colinus virginianus]
MWRGRGAKWPRVKAVDGDEQWILAEVISYSHAANKWGDMGQHTLSWRRVIPLLQWKANPETDPEVLFQREQLVLALYPQTTCFYCALIHVPSQPQDDSSVQFEDTLYADGYSSPLSVAQHYVMACRDTKKKRPCGAVLGPLQDLGILGSLGPISSHFGVTLEPFGAQCCVVACRDTKK